MNRAYTMSARLRALDLLRTVCRLDQDGYAVYDPGWSDKRVSRAVKPMLTTSIVKDLRREYIGKARSNADAFHARQKAAARQLDTPVAAAQQPADRLERIEKKLDSIMRAWGLGEDDDAATLRHK